MNNRKVEGGEVQVAEIFELLTTIRLKRCLRDLSLVAIFFVIFQSLKTLEER